MGDIENPRVWTVARVYVAPDGTAGPTNLSADWGAAWDDLGLISEDGMVVSRSQDSTDLYAFGGQFVRTVTSKHKREIKVTALESNAVLLGLVDPGSTVDTVGGITTRTVRVPSGLDLRAFGFETTDGSIVRRRIVPRGLVTTTGDQTVQDAKFEDVELTIVVYPVAADDDDGDIFWIDITNDTQADETASASA